MTWQTWLRLVPADKVGHDLIWLSGIGDKKSYDTAITSPEEIESHQLVADQRVYLEERHG